MNIPFRVAIPSYKRPITLKRKTLRLLQRLVPNSSIDVFVASEEEKAAYQETLGTDYTLIVGVPGIHKQREFIHNFYPEGAWVLCIDDDVSGLKSLYPSVPFPLLIERIFQITVANGCRLWGVYPTDFGPQMKDQALKGLFYILGAFYGMINWKGSVYPHPTTEDYTRSLLCYKRDGAVMRFDGLGPHTLYFKEPGGLQEYRTEAKQKEEMEALVAAWPGLAVLRQKHAYTDCRLKRIVESKALNPFQIPGEKRARPL